MNPQESDKTKPVLRRDATRPNQRYSQTASAAVCLERVLAHHGVGCPRANIQDKLNASLSDNDVINFLDVAEHFGVVGRPTLLKTSDWHTIRPVSILHWGSGGLVVFESFEGDSVTIFDPATGLRTVDMTEFRRCFSGLVLQFESILSAQG